MVDIRRRARQGGLTAVIAIAVMGTLAACSGSPGTSTTGTSGGALTTVTVALPTSVTSFANSDVAVADQLGYFKQAGIKVVVSNLKSGTSTTTAVAGHKVDIGGASIEPVVNASAGGSDIRIVGSYTDRLPVEMVTPNTIKTPADLRGKRLGIQEVGAFREVMTRMILENAGMTPQDVQYVSVGANAYISTLIQGQIDSAILQPEQYIQALEKDKSLHSLVNLNKIQPQYYYGTYFTSESWMSKNPKAVQGFVQAITEAHRTMYKDESKVVPIIAKVTQFDPSVIEQAWTVYMKQICAFPVNEGLDQSRLTYTVNKMREMNTLTPGAHPDLSTLIDRTPITAAVKALGQAPERCSGQG